MISSGEDETWAEARAGDSSAFRAMVDRHRDRVVGCVTPPSRGPTRRSASSPPRPVGAQFGGEGRVPLGDQPRQVARQRDPLSEHAERSERRTELDLVHHPGAVSRRLEAMDVVEAGERTTHLFVDEPVRRLQGGDPTRHPPHDPEVPCAPRDALAQTDRARRRAGDGALVGGGHRPLVRADVQRQRERPLGRGVELGDDPERHRHDAGQTVGAERSSSRSAAATSWSCRRPRCATPSATGPRTAARAAGRSRPTACSSRSHATARGPGRGPPARARTPSRGRVGPPRSCSRGRGRPGAPRTRLGSAAVEAEQPDRAEQPEVVGPPDPKSYLVSVAHPSGPPR